MILDITVEGRFDEVLIVDITDVAAVDTTGVTVVDTTDVTAAELSDVTTKDKTYSSRHTVMTYFQGYV